MSKTVVDGKEIIHFGFTVFESEPTEMILENILEHEGDSVIIRMRFGRGDQILTESRRISATEVEVNWIIPQRAFSLGIRLSNIGELGHRSLWMSLAMHRGAEDSVLYDMDLTNDHIRWDLRYM